MEVKKYTLEGRVSSSQEKEGIEGVRIVYATEVKGILKEWKTKTKKDGSFALKVKMDVLELSPDIFTVTSLHPVNFRKEGYSLELKKPYTSKKTIKKDLGIIKLTSQKLDLEKEKTKIHNINENLFDKMNSQIKKYPKQALRKAISKQVKNLKRTLIPLVLALLVEFAITNIQKALLGDFKSKCPDKEKLPSIIKKRNNLAKKINNLYKTVNSTIKALGVFNGLLELFRISKNIYLNTPIPVTIGVPPPTGGVVYSFTIGMILKQAENVKRLEKLIAKYQHLTIAILISLIALRAFLTQFLHLLKILDESIQKCVIEGVELEEIDSDLLFLLEEERRAPNPTENIVNGFILSIENETKQIGTLTRRFAVAKNKQGVILLKGEPSFSSNTQILMDELIFYIENNELKAF